MLGSGTASDPYIIQNVTDLQNMQNSLAAYYELGNNIDATGFNFIPVGTSLTPFTGNLNGKSYTVDSLTVTRDGSDNGLFGRTSGANIKNIGLPNINISPTGVHAGDGGLVGYVVADTTIDNCYTTGKVAGDPGSGDSGSNFIGGLIGHGASLTISNSYSTCSVSGATRVGGFIGTCQGTIDNCYARGSVSGRLDAGGSRVGGFVGQNSSGSTITNVYSTGAVTGNSTWLGGLCGLNSGTINNSFWDTETSGMATSDGGTGKTTAQMKTKSTFTNAGWNFTFIWDIDGVTNNGYPFLNERFIPRIFYF